MSIRNDLSRFVSSFLTLGSTRAKLFALELADEKQRWIKSIILFVHVLLFALLGLIMASVAVTLFFWDTEYRWWALFGVTAFHFLAALIAYFMLSSSNRGTEGSFANTRATLCADIERFSRADEQDWRAGDGSGLMPVNVTDLNGIDTNTLQNKQGGAS